MPGSSPISLSSKTSAAAALQAYNVHQYRYCMRRDRAHSSCSAFISGEMYEAVTRCFLCRMHNFATAGWKGTGSKLHRSMSHKRPTRTQKSHLSPDHDIRVLD